MLTDLPQAQEEALAAYGMHLGTAFQLVDDILDYSADAAQMGKNLGDDLAEGKPTLPLILAMQRGTPVQVGIIREAIEQGGPEKIDKVLAIIQETGVLDEAQALAGHESALAVKQLEAIDDSPFRQALETVARSSVVRRT